jgi:predicted neutral ceramidase superfamily lipid hydrolase
VPLYDADVAVKLEDSWKVRSFLVMRWFGSRRRISARMVSRLRLRALGHEPVSRWCVTPVAVAKPRLQKGQVMSVPRWILLLRCLLVLAYRVAIWLKNTYGLEVVVAFEAFLAITAIVVSVMVLLAHVRLGFRQAPVPLIACLAVVFRPIVTFIVLVILKMMLVVLSIVAV